MCAVLAVFAHGRQVSPSGLTHSNYIIIIIIIMCVELVYSCRILIRLPFRTGQTGERRWWSMSGGQRQVAVCSAGIKIQSQSSSVEWKFGQRAFCTSSTQQDNFVASAMVDHVVVVDQLVHSITSRPMRRSVIIQLFCTGLPLYLFGYISNYEVSVQQLQQSKYVEGEKFRVDRHLPCNF